MDEKKLEALLKSAVIEALDEQRALMREVVEEVIEDLGMLHAIQQGKTGRLVTKASVLSILERREA
jgi:hypothetical protein